MGLGSWWDKAFEGSDKVIGAVEDGAGSAGGWMADRAFTASSSRTGELAGGVYKGAKGILGKSAIAAALVGAAVAAPFILSGMRNSRRYPKAAPLPPEPAPLPPLMMDSPPNTMMGMEPTPGKFAAMVEAQRGGAAGIDTSNPGLMDVDGSGQQPQALGR